MKGIEIAVGLEYAGGDEELYREILADYAAGIEEQARAIEQAVAAQDIETFTIEVHSLKSTSRTIGAQELSNQAKELEEHGKRCEWEQIHVKTSGLLEAYRGLYSVITSYYADYCADEAHQEQLQEDRQERPLDREALGGLLEKLTVSLEAYDAVRAEEIIVELAKYKEKIRVAVPHSGFADLVSAMDQFDYEGCRRIVAQWREAWG